MSDWFEDLSITGEDFDFARSNGSSEVGDGVFIEYYYLLKEQQEIDREHYKSGQRTDGLDFLAYLEIDFEDSEFWITTDSGTIPEPIFEEDYL